MEPEIKKYVRTPHIRGSRFQHGDEDLEAVPWEELVGKHLVVEEKMDGSNCGVSFTDKGDLLLQSRGHYLRGGPREKQFNLLKRWASTKQKDLFSVLGSRYVMYGEWCAAKHTYFYDALPHYFMEFDVLDIQDNVFLGTDARHSLLLHTNNAWSLVCPVLVLYEGKLDKLCDLQALLTHSRFVTDDRKQNLQRASEAAGVGLAGALSHTDMSPNMEGLYVKWEENGVVRGRYKFVRSTFTNSILEQETHWHDRPIIQNQLLPGSFDQMFL